MENGQLTSKERLNRNPVLDKTFQLALEVLRVGRDLQFEKKEYIISRQIMRSGTSVGSMVREAQQAESKADFIHKMSIALKEVNETEYWRELLSASKIMEDSELLQLDELIKESIRMLTAIVKTSKENLRKN